MSDADFDDRAMRRNVVSTEYTAQLERPLNARTARATSFVFARVPSIDGKSEVRWGLVRRLQRGARVRASTAAETGAAVSESHTWGKWGAAGGVQDLKGESVLALALHETNTSADISPSIVTGQVTVNDRVNKGGIAQRLKLVHSQGRDGVGATEGTLVFQMNDTVEFDRLFPRWPSHRRNPSLVHRSGGECDATASFTLHDLKALQCAENARTAPYHNNFVTDTTWDLLWDVALPAVDPTAAETGSIAERSRRTDVRDGERVPWEFPGVTGNAQRAGQYRERPGGGYEWA